MEVKLFDFLGYQVLVTKLGKPPHVLIWGERVFVRRGRKIYRETSHAVITDTAETFKVNR